MLRIWLGLACFQLFAAAAAQAPPSTDIHLVELDESGSPAGPPRNLTDREGYDNQPFFLPDGKAILYTSQRGSQTDIYRCLIDSGSIQAMAETPEGEYSPTPMPDGLGYSVIRVEADGTQRLWAFSLDSSAAPRCLLPAIQPVGYQAWVDAGRVALFILGSPPTLQLADLASGQASPLAEAVGRSLHRIPGSGSISYVDKSDAQEWWITAIDPETGEKERLTGTRPGKEDMAWGPDGAIWMGDGGRLLRWLSGQEEWEQLADFSERGIADITRLAVSPDGRRLAFVSVRPAP